MANKKNKYEIFILTKQGLILFLMNLLLFNIFKSIPSVLNLDFNLFLKKLWSSASLLLSILFLMYVMFLGNGKIANLFKDEEKNNANLKETEIRKINIYINRFLEIISIVKSEGLFKESKTKQKTYLCIENQDFRNVLDNIEGDSLETLKVFRLLKWIVADRKSFTTTVRVEGKVCRRVVIDNELLNKLVCLNEKVV